MVNTVEIYGKEYKVKYSLQAILWFGDFLGVSSQEVGEVLETGMTDRKGLALMYSGLVAAAESSGKRLDISFSEFQEFAVFDDSEEVMETLGALFKTQFEVTASKLAAKNAKNEGKKKPKATLPTSKKST